MTVTPLSLPRKDNLIHQQILGALVDNKTTVRIELREVKNKAGIWSEEKIPVRVPTLAGNVSEENVNIIARRWIR